MNDSSRGRVETVTQASPYICLGVGPEESGCPNNEAWSRKAMLRSPETPKGETKGGKASGRLQALPHQTTEPTKKHVAAASPYSGNCRFRTFFLPSLSFLPSFQLRPFGEGAANPLTLEVI